MLGQLYYLNPKNAVATGSWNSGNYQQESETQLRNSTEVTDDTVSQNIKFFLASKTNHIISKH